MFIGEITVRIEGLEMIVAIDAIGVGSKVCFGIGLLSDEGVGVAVGCCDNFCELINGVEITDSYST